MRTIILEYLEARFDAGERGDYDPEQIAAALEGDVTPAAIERAIAAIDALFTEDVARIVAVRRRPVDPWLVSGLVLVLCGILVGCAADLPTAPSATIAPPPAPSPTPTPTGPPFFSLTLTGESPAYTDHWGLGIVVTPNRDVVSPPVPARVVVDCGTGSPTTMPGFVGTSGATCVFGQAGDYTVRVAAIAPDGWTASQTLRVSAVARPGPPAPQPIPPGPMYLTLDAREVSNGGTAHYAEWRFDASTSGRVVHWDFGDGNSADNDHRNEQHVYRREADYVVTVRAVPSSGGAEVSATRTITVTFCVMVDCP